MPLIRRRPSSTSIDTLRAKAEKSAAVAKRDAAAVKYADECRLAQVVVGKRADEIQKRIDDDAKWNNRRKEVSSRLGMQQRSVWDLSSRIDVATTAMNTALQSGDVEAGSHHASNVAAMQMALNAAQSLVQSFQQELSRIPVADIRTAERQSVPLLRVIARSPEKSHALIVPTLKVDQAAELRALGRRVAQDLQEHPQLRRQGFPAMRDGRTA